MIEIHGLQVMRGERLALDVSHLQIEKNEVLAIVGPNGAGKSTLLLALARLIKPERGEIFFDGKSVAGEKDLAYRRRIALVLQDPLLFNVSVFDNVASGLRFRGLHRRAIVPRADKWLEQLGIAHLKNRRASELSGGEGQRVSLARALVLEPELLLLDEPFGALDPPTRNRLLDDLRHILPESGTTTIFITHNLPEARQLAGRMVIIVAGRVRQTGAVNDILTSPADEEVRSFLAAENGIG
jgi:ABC-type sulfate/molybdate transport systems ATPase subunit